MAHVPFRADINEVSQGNAVRWNAAEEFYNNQGSNITLQHMSARHIIVFPSANITVTLPDTNTLLDGWQVHIGFPYSTSDNPFEITVKDAAGAEWRKLIKGQWCECVKKGGSWYVYPPGSVADSGTIVPGVPPPQPPTVPSGTVLQSYPDLNWNAVNVDCGGFLITPSTVNGYVSSFKARFYMLHSSGYGYGLLEAKVIVGNIVGTSYTITGQCDVTSFLQTGTPTNATYLVDTALPTKIPISTGQYVGLVVKANMYGTITTYRAVVGQILPTNFITIPEQYDSTTGTVYPTQPNTYQLLFKPVITA